MGTWQALKTLADIPRFHARVRPNDIALVCGERSVTYGELDRQASAAARALLAEKIKPGARIAWLDLNSERTHEMLFACAKVKAVFCPVNWRLSPAELQQVIADSEAELLFVGSRFFEAAGAIAAPRLRKTIATDGARAGWDDYTDWRERHAGPDPKRSSAPKDPAIQIYTSGATGQPKGVVLSAGGLLTTGKECTGEMAWNDWSAGDVSLLTMPCFHIAGLRWGVMSLLPGARTVIMPEFSPDGVLHEIVKHRVTRLFLAPTAIRLVLEEAKRQPIDFSSLKIVWYGASPMPASLLADAMATFGCGFLQTYGMTETGAQATFLPPADHRTGGEQLRSAGKALPGVRLRIVDAQGRTLSAGKPGEICIKSPSNMLGYWRRAAETRAALRDGWMHTGDAGFMDRDGYVYIQDRIKDMIVSGGENVYSAEVENALASHPAIAEAAVIGVPDETWGEAVKAIVVLKPGCAVSAQEVVAHVKEQIAAYKAPKSVDFVEALPKNSVGKVLKGRLREQYWGGRERMVN
ncbi:MAG: long-chain-fatty-acid--CoA ligase [Hyphomonadaceae bacterium]|nr:long-chain-fatty-acid--CoA ligase [Hyphomonadaceae bacterium]